MNTASFPFWCGVVAYASGRRKTPYEMWTCRRFGSHFKDGYEHAETQANRGTPIDLHAAYRKKRDLVRIDNEASGVS